MHRAGPHAPPFLVIHGSADTVSSVEQSRRFVQRLREVSEAPVCYAELPHAQHGFDLFPTARARHTVAAIHRFLATVHDRPTGHTVAVDGCTGALVVEAGPDAGTPGSRGAARNVLDRPL